MADLLLDTCSIINLSYCRPVAELFKNKFGGRAGWVRAVKTELTDLRGKRPPQPQAGRAHSWAVTWLDVPIEVTDAAAQIAVEAIQTEISLGGDDDALSHLGEAASIFVLTTAGSGRLVSDDHSARATAQTRVQRTSGLDHRCARGAACTERGRSSHYGPLSRHVALARAYARRPYVH
jgi:hypothetical protein